MRTVRLSLHCHIYNVMQAIVAELRKVVLELIHTIVLDIHKIFTECYSTAVPAQ